MIQTAHRNSTKTLQTDVDVFGYSDAQKKRVICQVVSGASFMKVHIPVTELRDPLPADLPVISDMAAVEVNPQPEVTVTQGATPDVIVVQATLPAKHIEVNLAVETEEPKKEQPAAPTPASTPQPAAELPTSLGRGKKPQVYVLLGDSKQPELLSCKEALEFARKHGHTNVRVAPAVKNTQWQNSLDYFNSISR